MKKMIWLNIFRFMVIVCFLGFDCMYKGQAIGKQIESISVSRTLVMSSSEPNFKITENEGIYSERGIAMCTASFAIADALSLIKNLRDVWGSTLPIAITHCDELTDQMLTNFGNIKNIIVINVCEKEDMAIIPMDLINLKQRLRSWFCKAAALIYAPFNEVMVVDLDVVWFKNPDHLFNYSDYKESGALFFRDRFYHSQREGNSKTFHEKVLQLYESFHNESSGSSSFAHIWSKDNAKLQLSKNGVVYFWRHYADPEHDPQLDNYQDSSVIVLNRVKHGEYLKVLGKLIPNFNIGWGDKELYWIAAFIANTSFSFEPFLVGSYGGCGMILHFDPNDRYLSNTSEALPLYTNAEWFLEKFEAIGGALSPLSSVPTLATPTTHLYHVGASGCICSFVGCRSISQASINSLLLAAQWERKTRTFDHTYQTEQWPRFITSKSSPLHHQQPHHRHREQGPHSIRIKQGKFIAKNSTLLYFFHPKTNSTSRLVVSMTASHLEQLQLEWSKKYVTISIFAFQELSIMMKQRMKNGDCAKFGCAYIPFTQELPLPYHTVLQTSASIFSHFNLTNEAVSGNLDAICVPVTFDPKGSVKKLRVLTLLLTLPLPLEEGAVVMTKTSRSVYLFRNSSLHEFQSGAAFLKMGYGWGDIRSINIVTLKAYPIGETIPPTRIFS